MATTSAPSPSRSPSPATAAPILFFGSTSRAFVIWTVRVFAALHTFGTKLWYRTIFGASGAEFDNPLLLRTLFIGIDVDGTARVVCRHALAPWIPGVMRRVIDRMTEIVWYRSSASASRKKGINEFVSAYRVIDFCHGGLTSRGLITAVSDGDYDDRLEGRTGISTIYPTTVSFSRPPTLIATMNEKINITTFFTRYSESFLGGTTRWDGHNDDGDDGELTTGECNDEPKPRRHRPLKSKEVLILMHALGWLGPEAVRNVLETGRRDLHVLSLDTFHDDDFSAEDDVVVYHE